MSYMRYWCLRCPGCNLLHLEFPDCASLHELPADIISIEAQRSDDPSYQMEICI